MKKSLFSLLILSTMALSNHAIAEQHALHQNQIITISGSVIKNNPTCSISFPAEVNLDQINIDDIEDINKLPSKEISIKFSDCTNTAKFTQIGLVIEGDDTPELKNLIGGKDASNVSIQLVDFYNNPILLNEQTHREMKETISEGEAEFKLYAKYKKPVGEEIKVGEISSQLTFNSYINDDIKHIDF